MNLWIVGGLTGLLGVSGGACGGDIYTDEAAFLAAFEDNYLYLTTFDEVSDGPHPQLLYEFPGSFSFVLSAPGKLFCSGGVVSTAVAGDPIFTEFPQTRAGAFGGTFSVRDQGFNGLPGQVTLVYPDGTIDAFHTEGEGVFRGYVSYEWSMDKIEVHAQSDAGLDAWATLDRLYVGKAQGGGCYTDCNADGVLDLFDFICFVEEFNAGRSYADCDGDNALDLFDFLCFQNAFNTSC